MRNNGSSDISGRAEEEGAQHMQGAAQVGVQSLPSSRREGTGAAHWVGGVWQFGEDHGPRVKKKRFWQFERRQCGIAVLESRRDSKARNVALEGHWRTVIMNFLGTVHTFRQLSSLASCCQAAATALGESPLLFQLHNCPGLGWPSARESLLSASLPHLLTLCYLSPQHVFPT